MTTSLPETMKAVGYRSKGSIDRDDALVDVTLPVPTAAVGSHDLLVKIAAVSVNPIDTKLRRRKDPAPGQYEILGFDAVGVVHVVGPDCSLGFTVGDRVYYAGDITRPGTNAEYHVVDERIVGKAPARLTNAQAAALPLTTITAYEMLFDRLQILEQKTPTRGGGGNNKDAILIIGAAGGVGSIAVQLVRAKRPDMTIIATASRPETIAHCSSLGAHHVINHRQALAPQVKELVGLAAVRYVFSTTMTHQHVDDIVEILAPMGKLGLIDDPEGGFDVMKFKKKSISIHWELMFTRSMFQTADMVQQHELLTEVAALVDAGKVQTTLTQVAGKIDAATLKQVHAKIESGTAHGKIVLEEF